MNITLPQIKNLAKELRKEYGYSKDGKHATHSAFLEIVSQSLVNKDYNTFAAMFKEDAIRNIYFGMTGVGKTKRLLGDILPLGYLSKKEQQKIMVFVQENEEHKYRSIIPYANYDVATLLDWSRPPSVMDMDEYWESSEDKQRKMTENFPDLEEALSRDVDVIIMDGFLEGLDDGLERIYHKGIPFFPERLKRVDFYIATQRDDVVDHLVDIENSNNDLVVSLKNM